MRIRDGSGGIEGMPLQLLITVIVAGLTLAALLGWVMSVPSPSVIKSVSTEPATVDLGDIPADQPASKMITIRVIAYDASDAPIRGSIVSLTGPVGGVVVAQDADDGMLDGTVTFPDVVVSLPPGAVIGEIVLTIQKAGYPSKAWTIPVVRGR